VTEAPAEARLFTVGHSTHSPDAFLALLRRHAITAVADVRSSPFSRFNPQYNRDALAESLGGADIRYVFLGQELGARRAEPECYEGQKARYELIALTPLFRRGLDRVRCGMESFRVALLCAERDPLTCHRTILVCRHLRHNAGPIYHILDNGELEAQADAETRLLAICGLPQHDLFLSREVLVDQAYDIQGDRIAYVALPSGREDAP
jgi:uncharacterized protein (DUF488 family)